MRNYERDGSEPIKFRLITTFNAQITKWGFFACGLVIGILLVKAGYV